MCGERYHKRCRFSSRVHISRRGIINKPPLVRDIPKVKYEFVRKNVFRFINEIFGLFPKSYCTVPVSFRKKVGYTHHLDLSKKLFELSENARWRVTYLRLSYIMYLQCKETSRCPSKHITNSHELIGASMMLARKISMNQISSGEVRLRRTIRRTCSYELHLDLGNTVISDNNPLSPSSSVSSSNSDGTPTDYWDPDSYVPRSREECDFYIPRESEDCDYMQGDGDVLTAAEMEELREELNQRDGGRGYRL